MAKAAALGAGAGKALQSSDSPGTQPWADSWLQDLGSSCLPQHFPPLSLAQIHSISGGHKDRYTECNMPALGQLVGRLLLCHTCKNWQLRWEALDALHYLFRFIQKNSKRSCVGLPSPPDTGTA